MSDDDLMDRVRRSVLLGTSAEEAHDAFAALQIPAAQPYQSDALRRIRDCIFRNGNLHITGTDPVAMVRELVQRMSRRQDDDG